MKKWTRGSIIFLIIGISLLTGTIYRSNETSSSGTRVDLAPNSWGPTKESQGIEIGDFRHIFWSPRTVELEVRATAPIDVYVLDSNGIRQWDENKNIDALWSFEGTAQFTNTLEIPKRDKYAILLYNPTNETVIANWSFMIYGIEQDLLCASGAIIVTGMLLTIVSVITIRNKSSKVNQ
ncbi:MAG: hypothetical protein ACOWW1_07255 [archaeon]|nr:hypothetical protein [Candidatus Bathyarchaeum sp.]